MSAKKGNSNILGLKSCSVKISMGILTRAFQPVFSDDLFLCLRPLLIIGRIIFVVPITQVGSKDIKKIHLRWISIPSILSIIFSLFCLLNIFLNILRYIFHIPVSAVEAVVAGNGLQYSLTLFFIYAYFLLRSENLIQLMSKWRLLCEKLIFRKIDGNLWLHTYCISLFIWLWAALENFLCDVTAVQFGEHNFTSPKDASLLEKYYSGGQKSFAEVFPYNPLMVVLLFLSNKCAVYSWNFMDILIIVICRALAFKFKSLSRHIEKYLLENDDEIKTSNMVLFNGNSFWIQVRKDFVILCKLVEEVEKFVSPLILVSYFINIYCICTHLFRWLTPSENSTFEESLYTFLSFLQFLTRAFLVTYFAADIHTCSHQLASNLQKCPDSEYSIGLERLERKMLLNPVGVTGMGLFFITRTSWLSILNFIFTFEIVLLQANASNTGHAS